MSKPMTWSKPASAAVFAMPTIPPAGPGKDRVLPRKPAASVSPPFDCMKNSLGPAPEDLSQLLDIPPQHR